MGHFYRFHKVPTGLLTKMQNCKTKMDLLKFCVENTIPLQYDECEPDPEITTCKGFGTPECEECECFSSIWIELFEVGDEIFNFGGRLGGDNIEVLDVIKKTGAPLFTVKEIAEDYEDFTPYICTKETFWDTICWYRDRVVAIYEDLLREKSIKETDTRTQSERMEEHIRELSKDWIGRCGNLPPYNHVKGMETYCGRNIEHLIFNLVREFQEFDWEHYDLFFLGW